MSRFRKLSHTLWHCQYHIVWVPKYRLRILTGKVKSEVEICIRTFVDQQEAEVDELNVQLVPRLNDFDRRSGNLSFVPTNEDSGCNFAFFFLVLRPFFLSYTLFF